MNITSKPSDTTELSVSECWALARSAPVGRLAVTVGGGPDIFPVNHVVDHGTIVIRTAAGTKLGASDKQPVAFETDGYDVDRGEAWSVVVKGVARAVEDLYEVIDVLQLPVFPWQGGPKPYFLRIEPRLVTGRRVRVTGGHTVNAPAG